MPAVRHASHMTLEPWSAQSASETKAKRSELGAPLLTVDGALPAEQRHSLQRLSPVVGEDRLFRHFQAMTRS
jgi:hypothetical protein